MNTYFDILQHQQCDDNHVFMLMLNAESHIFKGHFPGEPIAPGVCNLQMILDCAQVVTGRQCAFLSINRCKFTHLVLPDGAPLTLTLSIADHKLTAALTQHDIPCMQLSALID